MEVNILVVDKDTLSGMKLLSELELPHTKIVFVDRNLQALKNVKKNTYDLIVLGDRLDEGTTFDVALEIKTGKRNRQVPVVCTGKHAGRVQKILNLLGPYAMKNDKFVVDKIKKYLEEKSKKSQGL